MIRRNAILLGIVIAVGCRASAGGRSGRGTAEGAAAGSSSDSTTTRLVPAGFGTLHVDDIAIRLQPTGMIIRLLPLDESVIRLLTTDSYQAMRAYQESNRNAIAAAARKNGVQQTSLWYVTFYGVAQESRFTPMELLVTNLGRDHRPLEVIPLTAGFAENQLRQRDKQSALYIFEGEIDVNQPVSVSYLNERNDSWQQILPRIEAERVRVRARAAKGGKE
jgi:hypothetical protein